MAGPAIHSRAHVVQSSHSLLHFPLPANIAVITNTEKAAVFFQSVKLNYSVALVRERTIPTERPPPVGEVSANFCG